MAEAATGPASGSPMRTAVMGSVVAAESDKDEPAPAP